MCFFSLVVVIFNLVPPPDDFNIYKIIGIVCGFLVMVGVAIFFVSFYKNKKNAMFNEIPTVRIRSCLFFFSISNIDQIGILNEMLLILCFCVYTE